MSSTNRGAERITSDHYPTPLSAFDPILPYLPRDGQIWECAWGDARLVRRMLENGIDAWGSDLNDPDEPTDFLADNTPRHCVLTNPPFSSAFEFCQHSLRIAGETFMLLRLNFLASKKRKAWFKKHEPDALLVLSDRPAFVRSVSCAKGKKCSYKEMLPIEQKPPEKCPVCGDKIKSSASDSCEYAWYYWGPRWKGIHHP